VTEEDRDPNDYAKLSQAWFDPSQPLAELEANERADRWRVILAFCVMSGAMIGIGVLFALMR